MERQSLIRYLHNDVSDQDIMVSEGVRKLIPVMTWGESGYDKKCVILNHECTIFVGIIVKSCGYVGILIGISPYFCAVNTFLPELRSPS